MSKIIQLKSSNVKRLQAVEITPSGSMVIIGGANGQGKSSVLDSIQYALGGQPDASMPVRAGEDKAMIVVDLGDIVVRRTLTAAGGSTLVVSNADGQRQLSPQTILDKLTGRLTFDPLEFSRQKPAVQAETLRKLVGLDFETHDQQRQKLYDKRTEVNRDVKNASIKLTQLPHFPDAPEQEQSLETVLTKQREASEKNTTNARIRRAAEELAESISGTQNRVFSFEKDVEEARQKLRDAEKGLVEAQANLTLLHGEYEKATKLVGELQDVDLTSFKKQLTEMEEANRHVRANKARMEANAAFKAKEKEAEKLTAEIDEKDSYKRKATNNAKYPIAGLSFSTAGGVTFNDIPFDQCSSAEQLRVSVAIGLALNPTLKVLLIRDGSLLDDESMKAIAVMAEEAQAQIWIERVGTDDETAVIIEDGRVKA